MSVEFTRVSLGRRMSALMVDWLACYFIVAASAGGIGQMAPNRSWTVLALFFGEIALLSALQGASLGHRIFGIKILRFSDGGAITPLQALIRSALLITVIFAITFDENGRGLHERLSGTVLTRS
ncbi:MAG: RDD family protein [Candidatus Planktophila sp.]|nr:RDD family protein [Candidatus Planktophila sp.]